MTDCEVIQGVFPREILGRVDLRERMVRQQLRAPIRQPARIAQVLAYAHCIQRAIERGEYRDCSDVAQRLGYTKARISQMMNLTLMAPSIQEEVLSLESVDGLEPMGEHAVRVVSEERDWAAQRARWEPMAAAHQRLFHLSR